jgi:hypothetical protein
LGKVNCPFNEARNDETGTHKSQLRPVDAESHWFGGRHSLSVDIKQAIELLFRF